MYNWSTDETQLQKDPELYAIWKLEQHVNFGLNEEKLNEEAMRKYWSSLRLDPSRRRFLSLLLHGTLNPD